MFLDRLADERGFAGDVAVVGAALDARGHDGLAEDRERPRERQHRVGAAGDALQAGGIVVGTDEDVDLTLGVRVFRLDDVADGLEPRPVPSRDGPPDGLDVPSGGWIWGARGVPAREVLGGEAAGEAAPAPHHEVVRPRRGRCHR